MSTNTEQNNCDVHLHAEIEALKQALVEKQNQLISMETACLRESDRQAELEDSIIAWQDKYDRLYESHKRVQKVNQNLEDKLLKLVDRNSGERAQLTSDVATLSVRLAQANYNIAKLQREIERYKTDINLAIQLLQCKPDSFVPQKVSSLPMDIQSKVSSYMRLETNSHSDSEGSTSGVGVATSNSYKVLPASDSPPPICPFPPTAMVYSMRGLDAQNTESNDQNEQMISPSVMAKYLEDELKASDIKHCDTCNCSNKDLQVLADEPKTYSIGTQTLLQGDTNSSLCLRCNSNLNSPSRTNSPYIMKLVRSSDSVISETKSSVSDFNDADKLFTPAKKDDLMVNPILGHHRLCDRTINNNNNNSNNTNNNSNNSNSNYNGNKQYQSTIISTNGTISLSGAIGNNSINHHQLNNNDTAKYLMENQYKNNNNNNNANSINNTNANILNNNISNNNNKNNNNNNKNNICINQNDDDLDLIDLNKFGNINVINNSSDTNKSPIMAVKNDITCNNATYINRGNSQEVSDNNNKLLSNNNNTSRKSDSSNLLIDNTATENKNDLVQGNNCNGSNNNTLKNSNNVIENTDDKKFIDNNPNDSLTSNNGGIFDRGSNLQTSATGSTNSLWSKTSSNEGAKIFENFNRNLIKTIKAENPKYRGPRLCALRIQNGSNNILLDGIESEVTPILYTRRQRFLDEELDDNKDIITSKISMVMSPNSDVINSPTSKAAIAVKLEATSTSAAVTDILTATPLSPNKHNNPNDNFIPSEHSQQIIKDNVDNKLQQNTNLTSSVIINNNQSENQDNSINSMNDNKLRQNNSDNLLDQQQQQQQLVNSPNIKDLHHQHHHHLQHRQQYQYHQQQQQQHTLSTIQNYDMITLCDNSINSSCKNTTNSKSRTQSSSISSNCPDTGVDLQENALLRCQQLTRVAEWVQNNSQMGQNMNSHNKSLMNNSNTTINNNSNATTVCNFNDPNNINNNVSDGVSNSNYSSSICSNSNHHNISNIKYSLENNNVNNNNSNASIDILSNNGFKYKIKTQQLSSNTSNDNDQVQQQQRQNNKKQLTKNLSLSSTSFDCNYSQLISNSNANNNNSNTINLNDNKFKNQYQCPYMNANDNKIIVAQNKQIINRKYYNDENNRNLLKAQQYQKSKQLNGRQDWQQQQQLQQQQHYQQLDNEIIDKQNNNVNNDEEQQVDLAQMEYNVKQFLLKQNEWSIRNKSIKSTTTSSSSSSVINNSMSTKNTTAPAAVTAANAVIHIDNDINVKLAMPPPSIDYCHNSNNNASSLDIMMPATVKSHPHRTETNL